MEFPQPTFRSAELETPYWGSFMKIEGVVIAKCFTKYYRCLYFYLLLFAPLIFIQCIS